MRKIKQKITMILCFLSLFAFGLQAQDFMRAEGKNIVDINGNNFISRSIGTGNWMIQEGYMMKSTDAGINTQWQFTEKLIETIGQERTDSFYNVWLSNHFTRADVDSMKAWGFNAVRPALHYKLFTLPIEDEPVAGKNTWLDKGFVMVDSLIKWCADNEMYVFLDMHGTPGGQGTNMDISDYNPAKDALWENQENKDKLIALWKKLAERYKDEKWVGGYDLINETNWSFTESGNKPLWDLFIDITEAIREVDQNHIIILEGNGFANDYNGLPALWDDNMVLSFHKYWSYNDENSLDWMINLRDQRNVPLWLGESGENSNTWFTQLISLAENKNIGWSWWPVKKGGINNVMEVTVNDDYTKLLDFWKNGTPAMTADEAFQAVLTFADNHKIENCFIHYDVIDAMMRQASSIESVPFIDHKLGEPIFFSDYDFGRNNVAYTDSDTANYNSSTGTYVTWNAGWSYRNDGVDIERCTDVDEPTNGYNVGWTSDGEWMQYSLKSDSLAGYSLSIRHASGGGGSKIHIEVNGVNISGTLLLPGTGGWQTWKTDTFNDLILPGGNLKLKIFFEQGGSNLSFFNFTSPKPIDDIDFVFVSAKTSVDGSEIYVDLNKEVTTDAAEILLTDFELMVDLQPIAIQSIAKQASPTTVLVLNTNSKIYSDNEVTLSYNGTSVKSGTQNLMPFSNMPVKNNVPTSYLIPGKIQAEDFTVNNGLVMETCEDTGGGQNTGYAAPGDYLDYNVHVTSTDTYMVDYRVATERSNSELVLLISDGDTFTPIDTIKISSTTGWQKWETQSSLVSLTEGYYQIRLLIKQGEYNINWFQFTVTTAIEGNNVVNGSFSLYPNPAKDYVTLKVNDIASDKATLSIFSIGGNLVSQAQLLEKEYLINTSDFQKGIYFIQVQTKMGIYSQKLIVQ
jgi:hypothetical protein